MSINESYVVIEYTINLYILLYVIFWFYTIFGKENILFFPLKKKNFLLKEIV